MPLILNLRISLHLNFHIFFLLSRFQNIELIQFYQMFSFNFVLNVIYIGFQILCGNPLCETALIAMSRGNIVNLKLQHLQSAKVDSLCSVTSADYSGHVSVRSDFDRLSTSSLPITKQLISIELH